MNPVVTLGITAGTVTSLAMGNHHTCALIVNGEVKCWGQNTRGNLGDGTIENRNVPDRVSGLSAATFVGAGHTHSCAAIRVGGVLCWGAGDFGQLGNGASEDSSTPVPVSGIDGAVIQLDAGGENGHTCALLEDRSLMCCGANMYGQLSDGTPRGTNIPVNVTSRIPGVIKSMKFGFYHTCVLLESTEVLCWGKNTDAQLGDGTTTDRHEPTYIPVETNGVPAIGMTGVDYGEGYNCVTGWGWGAVLGKQCAWVAGRRHHQCAEFQLRGWPS